MSYWDELLRDRFGDRNVLSRDEAKCMFWADLPVELVDGFFDFFELEYSAPAGILRPTDGLCLLTHPIRTKNPLRWLFVESALEDKASELNYQIWKRAEQFGITDALPVYTVDEYVHVWCGHPRDLISDARREHNPVAR